jgi:hypothetical protein
LIDLPRLPPTWLRPAKLAGRRSARLALWRATGSLFPERLPEARLFAGVRGAAPAAGGRPLDPAGAAARRPFGAVLHRARRVTVVVRIGVVPRLVRACHVGAVLGPLGFQGGLLRALLCGLGGLELQLLSTRYLDLFEYVGRPGNLPVLQPLLSLDVKIGESRTAMSRIPPNPRTAPFSALLLM